MKQSLISKLLKLSGKISWEGDLSELRSFRKFDDPSKKALTNNAGDVRELKQEDIAAMRPADKVLPADLLDVLPKRKQREIQQKSSNQESNPEAPTPPHD